MQIPVGIAYDRFGTRRVLCTASIILCLGVTGLGISQNFWQALIARLFMGVGGSFGFIGMMHVASAWFPKKYFGILIGIGETLGMAGVAIAEIVMAWVISKYGWRTLIMLAANIMALVNVFLFIFIHDRKRSTKKRNLNQLSSLAKIRHVVTYPQIWLAGFYGFALFSMVNVIVTLWGIPYFLQYSSLITYHDASSLMSMVFIGIGVGAPINSWLVARLGKREQVMIGFAFITALLFGLIIYVPNLSLGLLYIILLLIGFFSASYIHVYSIVKESCPLEIQGTALATTNMILMSSALLLQPLIGKFLELKFSYSQSLSIIEVILVLAMGAAWLLLKKTK